MPLCSPVLLSVLLSVFQITVFRTPDPISPTIPLRDMSATTTTTISGTWTLKYQNIQSITGGSYGDNIDLLEVGTLVNAMHAATSEREYYPGTILVVNTDGTYAVQFLNGHHEESLSR